jgi:acyl-CoA reductase-like NAD-dependent aldehyde dehydrogenase
MQAAAASFTRTLLELGGKSAHIVLSDADLDMAVPALAGGIFKNAGQRCLSGSRLVIDRRVADEVEARVIDLANRLVVGDPFDPATHVGAMIDDRAVADAEAFVAQAVADGARVAAGGARVDALRPGSFFRPTVLTEASRGSFAAQTELFGPVATMIRVDGVEEAIAVANDSRYGLTGAVWTRDLDAGAHVAYAVRAGYLWVNTFSAIFGDMPFGGFKASGIGREAGDAGFEAYTELKSILTDTTGGTTALRFSGL